MAEKKFKVIFVERQRKDGSTFLTMMTIIKNKNGEEQWVNIKFGDSVNTKVWKNKNQIVIAENKIMSDGTKNIRIPKSFEKYEYQGKTRYPYIYIQEILNSYEYHYQTKAEDRYVDADDVDFVLDEEDTDKVYTPNDSMPN